MAQTQDNTYATTAANAAAGAPNKVTVVNDGAGDRQVVVLGAGDGTTTLVDGTAANPINNLTKKNASPASTTMQNAATGNGNGTNLATDGFSTSIVSITASVGMSGGTTINFEASTDNTTFVAVQAITVGTNTIATTTTTTGDWQVDVTGYSFLRARISAYSAGTITIKGWPISIAATSKVINANIISNSAAAQTVKLTDAFGNNIAQVTPGDALGAAPTTVIGAAVYNLQYNGTNEERIRSMAGISAGSNTGIQAVGVAGGVMPIGTLLNTYSVRLTTNTTTTPTSSTAYISTIGISTEAIGTTSTVKIQDKQGTPLVLIPALATTTAGLQQYNFQTPIKMVSGIDIVTAGAAAATVDVFMNYYQ